MRKYKNVQETYDSKFVDYLRLAKRLGFLKQTDKKSYGVLTTDNGKEKDWNKILKLAKKYGFVAHNSFQCQFTVMSHKRQIKQFGGMNYCRNQVDLNRKCMFEYEYDGCLGANNEYDYSLCSKCSRRIKK